MVLRALRTHGRKSFTSVGWYGLDKTLIAHVHQLDYSLREEQQQLVSE